MKKIKLKTHKGTAKRTKITGTGEIIRPNSFGSHLLFKKSKRRKRAIKTPTVIRGGMRKNIKRALGV